MSNSEPDPLLQALCGQPVDIGLMSANQRVALLRQFLATLKPVHHYMSAKREGELALLSQAQATQLSPDHPLSTPIRRQGVTEREKYVEVGTSWTTKSRLRTDLPRGCDLTCYLLWSAKGELVAMVCYDYEDVAYRYDFVRLTDDHLFDELFMPDWGQQKLCEIMRLINREAYVMLNKHERLQLERQAAYDKAEAMRVRFLEPRGHELSFTTTYSH